MKNVLTESDQRAVLDILIEQLGVEEDQLTPEARIEDDLGADSLDKVQIIMSVEERFDLAIPDDLAESVATVEDLREALAGLLPNRKCGAGGDKKPAASPESLPRRASPTASGTPATRGNTPQAE